MRSPLNYTISNRKKKTCTDINYHYIWRTKCLTDYCFFDLECIELKMFFYVHRVCCKTSYRMWKFKYKSLLKCQRGNHSTYIENKSRVCLKVVGLFWEKKDSSPGMSWMSFNCLNLLLWAVVLFKEGGTSKRPRKYTPNVWFLEKLGFLTLQQMFAPSAAFS